MEPMCYDEEDKITREEMQALMSIMEHERDVWENNHPLDVGVEGCI